MRLIRIGVACISQKVGDFAGNRERLRNIIETARDKGCHVLVTPELALSGYSLEDRVWWPDIAQRSWASLEHLTRDCTDISVLAGLPIHHDSMMYNGAAFIHDGTIRGLLLKKYLPTYSIFYEGRNWTAWSEGVTYINGMLAGDLVFRLPWGMISAEICEDLWSTQSPAETRVLAGAEVICNLSASPFTPRKNEQRRRLVQHAAESMACVYAYANHLGLDNSRLVFDGGGFVATPDGIVAEGPILSLEYATLTSAVVNLDDVARARAENSTWRQQASIKTAAEKIKIVDLSTGPYTPASISDFATQMPKSFFFPDNRLVAQGHEVDAYLDELFRALALGLRDYFEKVGVFQRFLVALSGGRDSALCLILAVAAAKALREGTEIERFAERIETVYLTNPRLSSQETEDAARALAAELGVSFKVVSIAEETEIALHKAGELLGDADQVTDLARQNLQARVRGSMMLNWANSCNGLMLVTSNLSEAAVGYTTTGGDNQGGYSPIANVPKTLVNRLLEYIHQKHGLQSLEKVLSIPPSAELASDQQDETDLMPYVILDDLLYLFARRRMPLPDCWRILVHRHPDQSKEQLRTWTASFGKLFIFSQWKREQLPVALKVLDLDLDPKTGFRFPVTQSIDEELEDLAHAEE